MVRGIKGNGQPQDWSHAAKRLKSDSHKAQKMTLTAAQSFPPPLSTTTSQGKSLRNRAQLAPKGKGVKTATQLFNTRAKGL